MMERPMRPAEFSGDVIHVAELELWTRIGVPDAERADAQRLTVSLALWPSIQFGDLSDEIGQAVDYAVAAQEVQTMVAPRVGRLIETLVEEIAQHLLARFPIVRVRVELRKFALADAKYTAVIITRERTDNP